MIACLEVRGITREFFSNLSQEAFQYDSRTSYGEINGITISTQENGRFQIIYCFTEYNIVNQMAIDSISETKDFIQVYCKRSSDTGKCVLMYNLKDESLEIDDKKFETGFFKSRRFRRFDMSILKSVSLKELVIFSKFYRRHYTLHNEATSKGGESVTLFHDGNTQIARESAWPDFHPTF